MKVLLVMVSSLNGKITKGNDPHIYTWTSPEDKEMFFSHIESNNLIVMGRKTYAAARSLIKHTPEKRRIILTNEPKKYEQEELSGMLEFTRESPRQLISRMKKKGYQQMLLVGGSVVNSLFLKENLIDEIHVTIEPYVFGRGINLVATSPVNTSLNLVSIKRLNEKGTLYLVYSVKK
ncbi:MAG: dihydrofolate reductase family protein [Candidatus Roizmanbacteria bacterium]|nr:dihydrofolate reductase family protein [Candidatus Roizmanbacteria bacterium]